MENLLQLWGFESWLQDGGRLMLEKMCWASCLLVIFLCMGCTSARTAVPEEGKEKTAMTVKVSPMVKLNSGYEMPVLGLGTWTLRGEMAAMSFS